MTEHSKWQPNVSAFEINKNNYIRFELQIIPFGEAINKL